MSGGAAPPIAPRPTRREALALGVALATGALAACASLVVPRTIDVPEARLQELVARRFPVTRRLFDAIDIVVDAPRLTLQPDADRIAVEVALHAGSGGVIRSSASGSLLASGGLRYEPSDHTLRLHDVRVERFAIDGLPSNWQRQLDRLGKPLAEALLDDQVLYALRPKDVAALEGRGVAPGDLRVTDNGLTITLVPAPR